MDVKSYFSLPSNARSRMSESFLQLGERDRREVVALKNAFYYAGSAKYERCLEGGLRLQPETELLARIATDYDEMRDMNLVAGNPPVFEEILGTILKIQSAVNARYG